MRGWWSTRSRAKIWDAGVASTTTPRPGAPTLLPEPAPTVAAPAEPAPAVTPPAPVDAPSIPEPSEAVAPPEPPEAGAPPEPPDVVAPAEPTVAVTPPEPEPVVAPAPAPAPAHAADSPRLAGLFDPRPDDFAPRDITATEPPGAPPPFEVTIAESPYYWRTSFAGPDPAPPTVPIAASTPSYAPNMDSQGEFLRLLEVVTSMCDHVIEYIEADRAERRQMMEMLSQLGRVITEGSAAAVAAFTALSTANVNANPARPLEPAAETFTRAPISQSVPVPTPAAAPEPRERVIGGSMPAGPEPEPHVDLVSAESNPDDPAFATLASAKIHIAVEVRGRFGDRWVDGFEICEVMTTPSGPRYKLRRQRDGVVLPELFDATNIRHVENPEAAPDEAAPDARTDDPQTSRERSMGSHPSGTNGDSAPVNGSGYWSRS
jgi:hypothetical protein